MEQSLTVNYFIFSRSGKLDKSQLEGFPLQVISQIQWKKANVFDPSSYRDDLEKADGVVHSLGVIFSDPRYKDIVNSDVCTDLPKILGAAKDIVLSRTPLSFLNTPFSKEANPMGKKPGVNFGGKESTDPDQIFDKLNKESAVLLAKEFSKVKRTSTTDTPDIEPIVKKDKPFVYISAEDYNKLAPEEYIESKRAAESLISDVEGIRSVFLRPGFMIDSSRNGNTLRDHLGNAAILRNNLAKVFGVEECVGASPVLPVQTVAKAVVEALDDPTLSGPISLGALHKYATEFA